MVLKYYNLAEQPFGVTPDPRFLFMSPTHREAVASVFYSIDSGRGFTALIAEPGMGKTTLLFNFLQVMGDVAKTAFLFQAQDSPRNFVRSLLLDLGVEHDGQDLVNMYSKLNDCLVRETGQGKQIVVVIDEAQNLEEPVLEVVRMLSNFETPREKLMHIILAGQPALADTLANPSLVQFRQRISIIARLKPFNAEDTQLYIDHRLRVAGYDSKAALFTKRALAMIAAHSKGIPRNINNLCFNALSLGCALKAKSIDEDVMEEVLKDLDLRSLGREVVETEKQESRPPAVTYAAPQKKPSVLRGWWLKSALSVGLLLTLTGILTVGFQRSGRFPDSLGSQTLVQGSPRAASPPPVTDRMATTAPIAAERTEVQDGTRTESVIKPARSAELSNIPSGNSSTKPGFVIVQSGQTIFRICMDTFGTYDDRVLERIRELNPELGRLDKLRIGQKILIPTDASVRKPVPVYSPKLATVSTTTP